MKQQDSLFVGAGQTDITPAMGIQIGGDMGRPRPMEEIRDRLYARAVVIEDGKKTLCIISCDVATIGRAFADAIRRRAADILGTDPAAVMCHATQTHSAPMVGNLILSDNYPVPPGMEWLRGGDERYNGPFIEAVVEAAKQARAAMQPATLKAVRGIDSRCAFLRRYVLRDGTHVSHPTPGDPNILRPEGLADPEVAVVVFQPSANSPAPAGKAIAALLHHTCHPVFGYGFRWISADWPGLWAQSMRAHFGGNAVCAVLNGFCGNINPYNVLDPHHLTNMYLMADRLKETSLRILPTAEAMNATPVRWVSRKVRIPQRPVTNNDLTKARQFLADHPEPIWTKPARPQIDWEWVFAHATLDTAEQLKSNAEYDYEIQAFRIGEVAIVGCSGEPFAEAQLEIKCQSPARQTLVAHMCNDCPGYIPTREAHRSGGYEAHLLSARLHEDALTTITAEAKSILKTLFAE